MTLRHSIIAALILLGAINTATAGDNAWTFDINAAAGAQYDSNVGIAELDTNSGEADSIMLLSAGGVIGYKPAGIPFSFRAGYDYSGSSYGHYEEFDLDLHHGVAEVQYRNDHIDAALALDRYDGVLDDEHYVSITQVSPNVAHLFGSRLYVRAAWIASTRDYDALPERDARTSAARIDAYLLLENLDRHVSLSVQVNDEAAQSRTYDYEGFQVSVAYAHTFDLPLMHLKLKSSLRYEDRDYAYIDSADGERRQDSRWRARLEAEVPFSEHVSLRTTLEHSDNASNLDAAVLEKSVAGLELRVAF